jgi:hypothetical protein
MAAMDRAVARGLLLIGSGVVAVNAFALIALYGPDARLYVAPPGPFPILLVPVLAFAASVFGLWRMWQVWRGSH